MWCIASWNAGYRNWSITFVPNLRHSKCYNTYAIWPWDSLKLCNFLRLKIMQKGNPESYFNTALEIFQNIDNGTLKYNILQFWIAQDGAIINCILEPYLRKSEYIGILQYFGIFKKILPVFILKFWGFNQNCS